MITLIFLDVKVSMRLLIEIVPHRTSVHWKREGPVFRNNLTSVRCAGMERDKSFLKGYQVSLIDLVRFSFC